MQSQKQLSKSKQIQDQAYSYGVMGNIFSALEWYSKRSSKDNKLQIHFENYNNFNCGKMKTIEELREQIITQIEIFKFSYSLYVKEHGAYDFPLSLSKEQIIKYIKEWEQYIPPKDKVLYEAVINIINGKKVDSFVNELKGDGKYINPKTAIDMTRVVGYSQQMGAKVMEHYEKNHDYKVDMEIDKEEVGNKHLQILGKDKEMRVELEKKIKQDIEKIITLIEKRMGQNNIRIEHCYLTKKPNKIEEKDENTLNELKQTINNLQKKLAQYEKKQFGDYYYNDNTTDIDALSSYCVKLSEQCNKKKLPKLEKKIDKFYDILQSIKSDSNK